MYSQEEREEKHKEFRAQSRDIKCWNYDRKRQRVGGILCGGKVAWLEAQGQGSTCTFMV